MSEEEIAPWAREMATELLGPFLAQVRDGKMLHAAVAKALDEAYELGLDQALLGAGKAGN